MSDVAGRATILDGQAQVFFLSDVAGRARFEAARTSHPWFHTRIWFFPRGGVVLEKKKIKSIC